MGGNYNDVLDGKFSKFFDIEIEMIGLVYYFFLLIGYVWLTFFGAINYSALLTYLLIVTTIGFLFSLYLIFVQLVYTKKWCYWCLTSSIVTIIIFVLSLFSLETYQNLVIIFLYEKIKVLSWLQIIGIAIGTSAATLSALFTIIFLKDFKIDLKEEKKLTVLDQMIWLSITLLIITNLCFYIINPADYKNSSQLLSQIGILIILLINNSILSLYIAPKLIGIRIDMNSINVFRIFWLRQIALAMGIVSVISWYSILLIGFFAGNTVMDFSQFISYYLAATFVAIVLTQIVIILFDKIKVDRIKISRDNIYKFR